MNRPSNTAIYNRTPEIELGSENAIAVVQAKYPNCKIIEADVLDDGSGTEITLGLMDGDSARIIDVVLNKENVILTETERPDVPPGLAKQTLKERKPHAKLKE
jgi:hypothetical protein